jgi:hypothetical protein
MIHKESTTGLTPCLSTTWVLVHKTQRGAKRECNCRSLSRGPQEASARSRLRDLPFSRYRTNTNILPRPLRGALSQGPQGRACRPPPTENPSRSMINSSHRWVVLGPEVASKLSGTSLSTRHHNSRRHLERATQQGGKGSLEAVDRRGRYPRSAAMAF